LAAADGRQRVAGLAREYARVAPNRLKRRQKRRLDMSKEKSAPPKEKKKPKKSKAASK